LCLRVGLRFVFVVFFLRVLLFAWMRFSNCVLVLVCTLFVFLVVEKSSNPHTTRNNLPFINILNEDGTMNDQCGEFTGLMRYDCRIKIIQRLEELGLYRVCRDRRCASWGCVVAC
jgi:hypothetical protein